jgi:hypothetical protein
LPQRGPQPPDLGKHGVIGMRAAAPRGGFDERVVGQGRVGGRIGRMQGSRTGDALSVS